jgi:hypothetical protein
VLPGERKGERERNERIVFVCKKKAKYRKTRERCADLKKGFVCTGKKN